MLQKRAGLFGLVDVARAVTDDPILLVPVIIVVGASLTLAGAAWFLLR